MSSMAANERVDEEPSYQIPKREFNVFKLNEQYQQPQIKEHIFTESTESEGCISSYSQIASSQITSNTTKPYFRRLYSLDIRPEVKRKVEEDIIASNQRIHVLPDDVLCSLIINGYQQLGIDCDITEIMMIMNIDPRKSRVLELLQKVSTKNTIARNQENAFAIIVISPSKYIPEIFNAYLEKIRHNFVNKETTINNITRIMLKLEEIFPPIIQKPPRECASIVVYLYLKGNLDIKSRSIFNKKIFTELPGIVSTKFDSCFADVKSKFEELFRIDYPFMISCYTI